jgi:glycosyltransferase involved in cell wall biosynthesis
MYPISLSVFFPCFNEELNIEKLVLEAIEVLNRSVEKYEILIINDGSTDKTGLIADSLSKQYKHIHVIHHEINKGYGAALITGYGNAIHEWIFFTDGDNQFFINELESFLKEINEYAVIIGFRGKREDPFYRICYAQAWNLLVRYLFNLRVRDLNCAFKLVNRKVLEKITLSSAGAAISTELLVKAKYAGFQIKEIKVSHKERMFGTQTGANPKVVIKAFLELFKLHGSIGSHRRNGSKK